MADREATLEQMGLTEKAAPVEGAGSAPPPEPPKPTVVGAGAEPKPPEPPKPPETKPLAGKFKSVEDLEKSYLELEKKFHATPPAERAPAPIIPPAPESSPLDQGPAGPPSPERPDPILDPERFAEWVVQQATTIASQVYEGQRRLEELRTNWRKENSDIENLLPEVERAVSNDPRTLRVNNHDELQAIFAEHTQHYRGLASQFTERGRLDERSKIAGISPSAPQNTSEQPSTPPGEGTTAKETDPTDEFIAQRQKLLAERRGYGFSRDDASRSMNQ